MVNQGLLNENEDIYSQIAGQTELSEIFIEQYGALESAPHINFGGSNIVKITDISQALPLLNPALNLINTTLPEGYDRAKMSFFTQSTLVLSDGRTIDMSDQWNGSSFFVYNEADLLALCIGRRERILRDTQWQDTERGFIPLIVASPLVRGTTTTALLALLSAKSLIARGVKELNGSCEQNNKMTDKVYTKFAKERWLEGQWIRYIYDIPKIETLYNQIIPRMGLDISEINSFISSND